LTISQLAVRADLSPHTIRYYEREGILPSVARSGGRRTYSETEAQLVMCIAALRRAGMSLAMLKQFAKDFGRISKCLTKGKLDEVPPSVAQRWHDMVDAHCRRLAADLAELQTLLAFAENLRGQLKAAHTTNV